MLEEFVMRMPTASERIERWGTIYSRDGERWGSYPSLAAHMALADIYASVQEDASLLDLGCGYGRDLVLFRHVFPTMSLYGLDAAQPAQEVGEARLRPLQLKRFFIKDAFRFLESHTKLHLNVIFANYFLHLFFPEEQLELFRGMRRKLASDGVVIFSVVSKLDRHYCKGQKLGDNVYKVRHQIPWTFSTVAGLEQMLSHSGFQIQRIVEYSEVELVKGKVDPVEGIYVVARRGRD